MPADMRVIESALALSIGRSWIWHHQPLPGGQGGCDNGATGFAAENEGSGSKDS
jgi:hypothetical protein